MQTILLQTRSRVSLATLAAIFAISNGLLASPTDEISKAVSASEKTDAKHASPSAFVNAVSSVLVTVDRKDSAPYVTAAVTLRPDLKDRITATVASVYAAPDDANSPDRCISRNRRKVPVCCHCHTIYLPRDKVWKFLERHPQCRQGACEYDERRCDDDDD